MERMTALLTLGLFGSLSAAAAAAAATAAVAEGATPAFKCSFCAEALVQGAGKIFDMSSVPSTVFTLHSGTRGSLTDPWLTYYVNTPCGSVGSAPG
eukprot:SAG22_NODE_9731_length_573_cov_0.706751_1_plen_95_part_01